MLQSQEETRHTSGIAVFHHPFCLGTDERQLPAGAYLIHTIEEAHSSALGTAYVAVSVDLIVTEAGCITTRVIKPSELRTALSLDNQAGGEGGAVDSAKRDERRRDRGQGGDVGEDNSDAGVDSEVRSIKYEPMAASKSRAITTVSSCSHETAFDRNAAESWDQEGGSVP